MPTLDRVARRFELKLVYWGPARGGKTTSLRSLHGAFAPGDRGELRSVETADERTYYFDYVPLDLPRLLGHELRLHAFTVPGQDMYVETRRRILRGVDGVVFVADATRDALAATDASFRQLDECLAAMEGGRRSIPVVVAVNKQDVPGAIGAAAMRTRLAAVAPGRVPIDLVPTTALRGTGVGRVFRLVVVAAAQHTFATSATALGSAARDALLSTIEARLAATDDGADAGGRAAPIDRHRSVVAASPTAPADPAGLEAALDATNWMTRRDDDLRELHRQHANGRLLLELGRMCLEATDAVRFAAEVISTLTFNLDATAGWIAIPGPGTRIVLDGSGPAVGVTAREVARLGAKYTEVLDAGEAVRFTVPIGTGIVGAPDGKDAVVAAFATGDGRRGWILIVRGRVDRAGGSDVDDLIGAAGAYVGVTLARLDALAGLREANHELEARVEERTAELRRERDTLEERVRDRTRELEVAQRATVDAERRLLDLERTEGVRRLAAGLAHELNNPIGAACANLDFVRDTVTELAGTLAGAARDDAEESVRAVEDTIGELRKVAANVTSLFKGAAGSRRAALKTPVATFVREAVAAHDGTGTGGSAATVREKDAVTCGIPPAEGTRWTLRLLGALGRTRGTSLAVEIDRCADGPRITFVCDDPDATTACPDLDAVALEIERAGGALRTSALPGGAVVRVVLPRAIGEAATTRREAVG